MTAGPWSARTARRPAHFEHTVAITPDGPWVLTAADGGESGLAAAAGAASADAGDRAAASARAGASGDPAPSPRPAASARPAPGGD